MEPSSPQRQFPPPQQDLPIEKAAPHLSEQAKQLKEKVGEKALNVINDRGACAANEPSTTDAQITLPAYTSTTQKIAHTADQALLHEPGESLEERTEGLFSQVTTSIEEISSFQLGELVAVPLSADTIDLPVDEVFEKTVGQEGGEEVEEENPFGDMDFGEIGASFASTEETGNVENEPAGLAPPPSGAEEIEQISVESEHIELAPLPSGTEKIMYLSITDFQKGQSKFEKILNEYADKGGSPKQVRNDIVEKGAVIVHGEKETICFIDRSRGQQFIANKQEEIKRQMSENNVQHYTTCVLDADALEAFKKMLSVLIIARGEEKTEQKRAKPDIGSLILERPTIPQPPDVPARRKERKKPVPEHYPPPRNITAIEQEKRKLALQLAIEAARRKKAERRREERERRITRDEVEKSELKSARVREEARKKQEKGPS